jgi:16S rRNA (cytidine1402-2'-O)-methyltransferase
MDLTKAPSDKKSQKTIFVLSLPIGDDADLTEKAKKTLKTVDLLIGEESRFLAPFLKRNGIPRQFQIWNEHSRDEDFWELQKLIRSVDSIALVSDAGLPNLEDPGRSLIPKLRDSPEFRWVYVGGPSSLDAGLALAGFPTRPFSFLGLLPRDPQERKSLLKKSLGWGHTLVILETPYRYKALIQDLVPLLSGTKRRVFLGLNLTVPGEEFQFRGKVSDLLPLIDKLPKAPPVILIEASLS